MKKGLSAEEKRVCELMGINQHEYIEAREKERVSQKSLNQEAPYDLENKIAASMGLSPTDASKAKEQMAKEKAARAPLTNEELEICKKIGVEPLDYYAQKMADAGLKVQLS